MNTKKTGLPFAAISYKNLEKREKDLFSNPAIASALYLDPRFFTLLTPAASNLAKKFLEKT